MFVFKITHRFGFANETYDKNIRVYLFVTFHAVNLVRGKENNLSFFKQSFSHIAVYVNIVFVAVNHFPEIVFFFGENVVFSEFLIMNGNYLGNT